MLPKEHEQLLSHSMQHFLQCVSIHETAGLWCNLVGHLILLHVDMCAGRDVGRREDGRVEGLGLAARNHLERPLERLQLDGSAAADLDRRLTLDVTEAELALRTVGRNRIAGAVDDDLHVLVVACIGGRDEYRTRHAHLKGQGVVRRDVEHREGRGGRERDRTVVRNGHRGLLVVDDELQVAQDLRREDLLRKVEHDLERGVVAAARALRLVPFLA